MEIPSSHAGVLKQLKVKVGDKVSKGTCQRHPRGGRWRCPAVAPPATVAAPSQGRLHRLPHRTRSQAGERAPAARPCTRADRAAKHPVACLADDPEARARLGVPLAEVRAAGPRPDHPGKTCRASRQGRDWPAQRETPSPGLLRRQRAPAASAGIGRPTCRLAQVDFAKFGPIEKKELSRIKKISGPVLHRNWVMIPHVTNHDDADITDLEAFRVLTNKENEKSGVKVTMLAFLIKACVAALQKFPDFNASLEAITWC